MTDSDSKIETINKRNKRFLKYTIYVFLFLACVITTIFNISHRNIVKHREQQQYIELDTMREQLLTEYRRISGDLFYFSNSDLAKALLSTQNQLAKYYLTSLMGKISSLHKSYDQIRLLDSDGVEVIRINQQDDLSLAVAPETNLQNKYNRYYFQATANLNPGDIYISKYDLNMENGVIEQPIKPVVRFSTPIYSDQGEFLGVGIINYLGSKIIHLLESLNSHQGDRVYLINSDGYYLNSEDPEKICAFMYPDRAHLSFSYEQPDLWSEMNLSDQGSMALADGEYYFTRVQLDKLPLHQAVNQESLYIVMHVPNASIKADDEILITGLLLGFGLIFPVASFLTFRLSSSQAEQQRLLQELNYQAFHDPLTGLYNRQAIFEHLAKSLLLSQRRKSSLSIGFIDVNNLKEINDNHGHEAGDMMILGASIAITMSIRESDYAARLGGDEFLVVLMDCDEEHANQILTRIQTNYQALGQDKQKVWNLSFGCTEMLDADDTVDAMVERADTNMYRQKAQFKQAQEKVNLQVDKRELIDIRSHSMDLNSTSHAVQSLNFEGNIVDVSPKWLHLTGYSKEEVIGKHLTEFLDQLSAEKVRNNFPKIKGYGYVNNVALTLTTKEGKEIPTLLNGTSKYNNKGDFIKTFCEITPI